VTDHRWPTADDWKRTLAILEHGSAEADAIVYRATAFHEAGHAVISLLCGVAIVDMCIGPPPSAGAPPSGDSYATTANPEYTVLCVCIGMGGMAAEALHLGSTTVYLGQRTGRRYADSDWNRCHETIHGWIPQGCKHHRPQVFRYYANKVRRQLTQPQAWSAVEALAEALLERQCLSAEEATVLASPYLANLPPFRPEPQPSLDAILSDPDAHADA
jgi:hypothetical protein